MKTLISRRATKLPDPTKALLAVAAILGRRFSLKDLREVQLRVDGSAPDPEELAETLAPAVTAGLLIEHEEGSAADYSFQHEQVREFAAATLTSAARRAIHAAIVALLMSGEPSAASLPLIARHAKSAGDGAVCVRFSVEASRNALAANAPEEVLRVVELALPSASTPEQRVGLLDARDRALDMLRRPGDRMQGLAELAALAEALGDTRLGIDVRLRRAAAMRSAEEYERAAELAREVRDLAVERGDREGELAACMELGQDLMHASAGESFTPAAKEVDLDACDEAFRRAMELAHELGDVAAEAAATREVGVVQLGRVRAWFIEQLELGLHLPMVQRVAAGEVLEDIMPELPIAPVFMETFGLFQHALELFEQLGDRRGAMSTIIALAYLNWAPDIHLGTSSARHIEEIRRLTSRMKAFTNDSERAAFEAQMLYGSHVFARAKVIPDLALAKGREAHRYAKEIGDPNLEFLAAGGTAMSVLDLGDVDEARAWIDRAAAVATEHPSPLRARRLETWRGIADAAAGDAAGMRAHLERAVQQATDSGLPAARCEALARLAVESARLGVRLGDEELMALADRSAAEASDLAATLPGHAPWGAQADAARASVALARGNVDEATTFARAAAGALQAAMHEDLHLDVLLPGARVLMETGAPDWQEGVRPYVQVSLAMIAQRTIDEDVRVRWLRGPLGSEMVALAGPISTVVASDGEDARRRAGTTCCCRAWSRARRTPRSPASSGSTSRPSSGGSASSSRRSARRRARTPPRSRSGSGSCERAGGSMTLRPRVDRHRCVGAGTCITIAPTAFDWYKGDFAKAGVVDAASVDDEVLREAALACPTGAITIEDVEELLPWQLRGKDAPRRVEKTFMFTDIESSTNLVEALGDEVWQGVLRWHNEALRSLFAEHKGEEVVSTGDGFFVGFDSPDEALACAVAIQRRLAEHRRSAGFAPKVRIGLHASGATQVGRDFSGKGVHEAARIAALADGDQIVASRATAADGRYPTSEPRTVTLRGTSEPIEIVTVDWE